MAHFFRIPFLHVLVLFFSFPQIVFAESFPLHGSEGLLALKSEEFALLQGALFVDNDFDLETRKTTLIAQEADAICRARGYGGGADHASLLVEESVGEQVVEFNNQQSEEQKRLVGLNAIYPLHHPRYSQRRLGDYLKGQVIDLIAPSIVLLIGGTLVRVFIGLASRGHTMPHLPLTSNEIGYCASSVPFFPIYGAARYRRHKKEKQTGRYHGSSIWDERELTDQPRAPHLVFSQNIYCFKTGYDDAAELEKQAQNVEIHAEEKSVIIDIADTDKADAGIESANL